MLPAVALALALLLVGGCTAFVWGFLRLDGDALARVVLDQFARRTCSAAAATRPATIRATTGPLALITTGEGWHNNHHHYQSSANQGFRWWEIDVTYYCCACWRCAA